MRVLFRGSASVLVWIGAVLIGVLVGALAFALLLNVGFWPAVVGGFAVLFLATWLLSALAQRIWPSTRSRPRPRLLARKSPYVVGAAVTAVAAVVAGATILAPIEGTNRPTAEQPPQFWDLETGSRVAYWKSPAKGGGDKKNPIVFIHGGPGGYVFSHDREVLGGLADTGRDVYFYDQPGAGFSPELDRKDYTQKRMLADLDAVRGQVGADKLILIGQSSGAYVVEAYAANYPDRVEKAILTAPGAYDPNLTEPDHPLVAEDNEIEKRLAQIDPQREERNRMNTALMEATLSTPRYMASMLVSVLFGERAGDNLWSVEDGKRWSARVLGLEAGINGKANSSLVHEFMANWDDTIGKLREQRIPTMLLKPEFDYVGWTGQREYLRANQDSCTVYLKGAEHGPWKLRPAESVAALAAYIEDRPQPYYVGSEDPRIAEAQNAANAEGR